MDNTTPISGTSAPAISVAIIGAGNVGCALAADLAKRGFRICLYTHPHPDNTKVFDYIAQRGTLLSVGNIEGEFTLHLLTTDIKDAASFAKYILVALPSFAQDDLFSLLVPHLSNDHTIVVLNGNFGSLSLLRLLQGSTPTLIETNVAPHASRVDHEGKVTILGTKTFLSIGSCPAKIPDSIVSDLGTIFPCRLDWCGDVLEVALQSNNGVIHPAPSIMNAGRIESTKGDFYFYKDGISPAVGRVIEQIDSERVNIGKRFGFNLRSLLAEMIIFYGGQYATISEFALNSTIHNLIKDAPADTQHRYIIEDVPFALVPWYHLGQLVGIEAKAMKAIIDLASIVNSVEYMDTGRNLNKLGVSGMDKVALLKYVRDARPDKP